MTPHTQSLFFLERLGRVLQNDSHASGLKPTHWEVLRYLARANKFSCHPKALTQYLGITKGTVSQTLNVLERKGFVEKQTDTQDKRGVLLALTGAGRALLEDDPIFNVQQIYETMDQAEQQALSDGLTELLKRTLNERGGVAFGKCMTCIHFEQNTVGGSPHQCSLLDEPLTLQDSQKHCIESKS